MTTSLRNKAPASPGSVIEAGKQQMNIVIGGHVDHGKSTIIGRLMADTHSLPEGKLEQIKALCERTARPFEYAFLLDALKDEQAQGITIDSARVFFKTAKRDYIIIDAPGHIEFLKNMVTGASRAEAALLVIDAKEGVQENSRRHGYMMSMLGIRQIAVLVNKMDLVNFDKGVFDQIVGEYTAFLANVNIKPAAFIPVAGRDGENIAAPSAAMPWYTGHTVLAMLDAFQKEAAPVAAPFRMPVQDIYKFTKQGDDRRIVAGTIDTGAVSVGDEVVFYPSGKKSRVKSIEGFNTPVQTRAEAGQAAGFTLHEQIYVARGEMATLATQPRPKVTTRLKVNLFWLGKNALVTKKDYILKLGTTRVPMRLEEVHRVIDASDLSTKDSKQRIDRNDVAECTVKLNRAIAFDLADEIAATSRFVVIDDYEIRGGGIIREALPDKLTGVRDKVLLRNYKWESSIIPPERRAEKLNQRSVLVLITGEQEVDRKSLAKGLESRLFEDGKVVYYLGIGNVLYGVDADIERKESNRQEHMRRLAEVANLMLDAGVILVVTAAELTQEDLELVKTTVEPERIETIWVGDRVTTDITCDLVLTDPEQELDRVDRIKALLQEKGVIYRPW
jgi:bifunctional enzyme CysN/CysC